MHEREREVWVWTALHWEDGVRKPQREDAEGSAFLVPVGTGDMQWCGNLRQSPYSSV